MRFIKTLFSVLLAGSSAFASDAPALVAAFCYVEHAVENCGNLSMRLDTGSKVEQLVGASVGDPRSPFADACADGLLKAVADQGQGALCKVAWDKYGCGGSQYRGLVQEDPFQDRNPKLCSFTP